jgi:hypothetical protein
MGKKIFWAGIAGIIVSLLLWFGLGDVGGIFGLGISFALIAIGLIISLLSSGLNEKGKQFFGCILFLLGLVGFVISYFLSEAGYHSTEDIPQGVDGITALILGGISLILLVAGIILFFKGISQKKKLKNLTEAYKLNPSADKDDTKKI